MASEMDYARLAAYIDGEGCISITKIGDYKGIRLDVYNTDPRLIVWIHKTCGGGWVRRDFPKEHQRFTKYAWYITSKKASDLLKKCLPYFIIKREEADLAIAYQETKKYHRWNRIPDDVKAQRVSLKEQLTKLHNTRLSIAEFEDTTEAIQ